jgi:hypothetical protein
MDHVRYVWSWTIRRLSVESVWCIGRVFPCRVYIDSNHRDSQICKGNSTTSTSMHINLTFVKHIYVDMNVEVIVVRPRFMQQ